MVSSKCLQEINRLRQTYRPDLPQYTIPREPQPQIRKQKQRQKVDGIGSQTNQCFAFSSSALMRLVQFF